MKVRIRVIYSYLFVIFLVYGCANPSGYKELKFSEPTPPNSGETLIYVFRENRDFPGARLFTIICNDTVMGLLTPGTFCNFKIKSGENEIVAFIPPRPFMHYRVQDRPGKTVFIFCRFGYDTGSFMEEIDENRPVQLMQEFRYTKIAVKNQKVKMNYKDFYDNLYK